MTGPSGDNVWEAYIDEKDGAVISMSRVAVDALSRSPTEEPEVTTGHIPELALLLDEVVTFVRRYVVLSSQQADATALWDAHAHAFAGAETTPYLSVRSPEKRSGKTRLLEVQENLVPYPLKTENISVAALVYSVDKGVTLLLDEVDSVFGK